MPMNPVSCQGKLEEFFNGVNWPIPNPITVADAHMVTASKWEEALIALNITMEPLIPAYVPIHAATFKALTAVNSLLLISNLSAYAASLAQSMIGVTYFSPTPGPVVYSAPPSIPFSFPAAPYNNPSLVASVVSVALYTWFKGGNFIYLALGIAPTPGLWQ